MPHIKKLSENVPNQQLVMKILPILSVTKVNSGPISVQQTEKQMWQSVEKFVKIGMTIILTK